MKRNMNYISSSADSREHVQGPQRVIVSEPGVAGKNLGKERVVAVVGGAVFHYSAKRNVEILNQ